MEDELIEFINNYLESELNILNIGRMKWEIIRNSPLNITNTDQFDDLKLSDFLILYKINRLVDLKIINENIGKYLKNIFYIKLNLEDKLKSLVNVNDNDNKELIDIVCNKIIEVENILKKYNLDKMKIDLKMIIDSIVLNEKSEYINDEIKVKKIDF